MPELLPIATWRAQFTPHPSGTGAGGWRFEDAASLADFLRDLGISHLYASPILEARAGSTHGYDVTNPARIREELGGADAFLELSRQLQSRGLGIILDIVPNHMAADSANPWWWDLLARGQNSPFAAHFDIDWTAGDGKIILPILGRPLDEATAEGEITLDPRSADDPTPTIHYYDKRFPLAHGSADGLPNPPSPSDLRQLLQRQHYRLTFWRDGLKIINYRRFFDIADLVCIRIEDQPVFDDTHRLIFHLLDQGHIRGLRIDHIDGLFDPRQYLKRLRARMQTTAAHYLIVEKILAEDEHLPTGWPVDGASGYEFLSHINPLFIEAAGAAMIEADAHHRLSAAPAFAAEARNAKRFIIRELFIAETDRLTQALARLTMAAGERIQPEHLREAIIETTAAMQVYRTYITGQDEQPTTEDRRRLTEALDAADACATESAAPWKPALAFLRTTLLQPVADTWHAQLRTSFIARWQQFSGPVMAKGIEDTALYRRITLASLNDVGCDPDQLPLDPVDAFHTFCQQRWRCAPGSLNTTSTHDTKRGEDTRLRISALASVAPDYLTALDRWFDWHAPIRATLPDGPAPSPTDEVLIYQSLLALWPADDDAAPAMQAIASRLCDYLIKAAREARLRSSWHTPDKQYEEALRRFITALITGPEGNRFREDSRPLRHRMALAGALLSLSQVIIKCTAPGIPDFYRGTELWDLSLVDPDNRRPVDFERRQSILAHLQQAIAGTPADHTKLLEQLTQPQGPLGWHTGAIKMYTTMRALAARNENPLLFQRGRYIPLTISGSHDRRIVAFARQSEDHPPLHWAITIVPRLIPPTTTHSSTTAAAIPIANDWADAFVILPDGAPSHWRNILLPAPSTLTTDPDAGPRPTLAIPDLLRHFPVALLTTA